MVFEFESGFRGSAVLLLFYCILIGIDGNYIQRLKDNEINKDAIDINAQINEGIKSKNEIALTTNSGDKYSQIKLKSVEPDQDTNTNEGDTNNDDNNNPTDANDDYSDSEDLELREMR